MPIDLLGFVPWLPAVAAALCGACCVYKPMRKWAGYVCVGGIGLSLLLTLATLNQFGDHGSTVRLFEWIAVGGFEAHWSYWIDGLTTVMLLVVTGIGSLIAVYATGYMKGDPGYARFFAGVSLFIFAMTTLVMADNLVLLYLGWEGVGLCSYLLIGYYYKTPVAVAAAKKAFIVNRIGDLGFALGIFLTYQTFGSVEYSVIIPKAEALLAAGGTQTLAVQAIPFLLMLGAFGKSAQGPLFVWLPDAMAGPTPVSALVHAATMVTSGVYLIARAFPLFELSYYALPTVALIGVITALFAATIALCSNDLKGVFAYSTVSQLGYMFVGVAALSTTAGVFHLVTHAFFKALLFLTAGSVMHALAGQLDIRTMSGLRKKMPVTCWLMFAGCLALAGFPLTAGFFSKDKILAEALVWGLSDRPHANLYLVVTVLGLITAFLTAFYTFRLWFRVFMGEERYEMGDEHHHDDDEHAHDAESDHAAAHDHHDAPHEMPWWPMNGPLVVLAVGSLLAGVLLGPTGLMKHWIASSTAYPLPAEMLGFDPKHPPHPYVLGLDAHTFMIVISSLLAVSGIALAAYFHWLKRPATDAFIKPFGGVVTLLRGKYYVDEAYDAAIVKPLWLKSKVFWVIDELLVQGLVLAVGWLPGAAGRVVRPLQSGRLQGYGLGMVAGVAALAVIVFIVMS